MEACPSYKPWHDKQTHQTFLKGDSGKCLHYYFYFVDRELGLCYLRVPTWAPFRLQFYFNGHNALCAALGKRKIEASMLDNAFARLGDWDKAQKLADAVDVKKLHRKLADIFNVVRSRSNGPRGDSSRYSPAKVLGSARPRFSVKTMSVALSVNEPFSSVPPAKATEPSSRRTEDGSPPSAIFGPRSSVVCSPSCGLAVTFFKTMLFFASVTVPRTSCSG